MLYWGQKGYQYNKKYNEFEISRYHLRQIRRSWGMFQLVDGVKRHVAVAGNLKLRSPLLAKIRFKRMALANPGVQV